MDSTHLHRWLGVCSAVLALAPLAWADPWPAIAIPAANARSRRGPAPRPPSGELSQRARWLLDAIRTGAPTDTERALGFFLQRDPFLAIKDMGGAAGYFATLVRAFRQDIQAYRRAWPPVAHASFVRFDLSTACVWMDVGHEANRLPYWSCYRSHLVARADGQDHVFDVRVMINWGDHWYCTHLAPRLSSH